jgi:hypothetical protein
MVNCLIDINAAFPYYKLYFSLDSTVPMAVQPAPPNTNQGTNSLPQVPATDNLQPQSAAANSMNLVGTRNIADILLTKGLIDADTLKKIRFESINSGKPVEQILVTGGYLSEVDLYKTKAEIYNVPYVDLGSQRIDVEVLNRLPQEIAKNNMAVAYEDTPAALKVAMVDPLDLQKVRFLSTMVGKNIEPYFADPTTINGIIDTKYGAQIGTEVT